MTEASAVAFTAPLPLCAESDCGEPVPMNEGGVCVSCPGDTYCNLHWADHVQGCTDAIAERAYYQ